MTRTLILLATVLAAAPTCLGDEIVLKPSVRLGRGATDVRLADVADLRGPLAEALADTVIAPLAEVDAVIEIPLQQVRRVLDGLGVHWGKLQLSGRCAIVRPAPPLTQGTGGAGGAGSADPLLAMTGAAIAAHHGPEPSARARTGTERVATVETAADLITQDTLRGEIARMISRGLPAIGPASLRLVFDEQDEPLLSMSLTSARFEIRPLGSFAGDRIALSVGMLGQDQVASTHAINLRPLYRTEVPLLKRELRRGETLQSEDLTVQTRWLSASLAAAVIGLDQVIGREAAERLKEGAPLRREDLVNEVVIERGDRVIVRCLVGGLVVSLEAEARGDAGRGEQVELRKLGDRNTFFATATGQGSAEVDLSRTRTDSQGAAP